LPLNCHQSAPIKLFDCYKIIKLFAEIPNRLETLHKEAREEELISEKLQIPCTIPAFLFASSFPHFFIDTIIGPQLH
jgi:hypothetical protein